MGLLCKVDGCNCNFDRPVSVAENTGLFMCEHHARSWEGQKDRSWAAFKAWEASERNKPVVNMFGARAQG